MSLLNRHDFLSTSCRVKATGAMVIARISQKPAAGTVEVFRFYPPNLKP